MLPHTLIRFVKFFQELPSVASELVNDLDRVQKELLLNLEKIVRCVLQSGLANFGRRVG